MEDKFFDTCGQSQPEFYHKLTEKQYYYCNSLIAFALPISEEAPKMSLVSLPVDAPRYVGVLFFELRP